MFNVIISIYKGMMSSVKFSGEVFDSFTVSNGTKRGCILALFAFALYFSVMLETAFESVKEGVKLEHRSGGGLYSLQSFKAKANTIVQKV